MTTTLWPRSGDRQLKKVAFAAAVGAKVQFFAGGTTTPLTVYTDAAASTPHNVASLVTDGNGQWPMIFVPYGSFDFRVLDSDNTIISTASNVPNPAPIDPTVTDPNALLQTGDMIFVPAAVTRAGFVRSNGNTIGSGASSGSERANDDAEALFTWIWNNVANDQAPVTGGRGASAAADWSANKTIATLDFRRSMAAGLDDMGASAAGGFASAPFTNGNATTGGSVVGGNTQTLITANLPAHAHGSSALTAVSGGAHTHTSGTLVTSQAGAHSHTVTDPGHTHTLSDFYSPVNVDADIEGNVAGVVAHGTETTKLGLAVLTGISIVAAGDHGHVISGSTASGGAHTHTISGSTDSVGSGDAFNILSRSILGTYLQKL